MLQFDWRSDKDYLNVGAADRLGFAWECLRRSSDYCRQYQSLRSPLSETSGEFQKTWGLTFRG